MAQGQEIAPYSSSAGQAIDRLPTTQRCWSLGVGTTRLLDTYLSQEHFRGTGITLLGNFTRTKPDSRWATVWQHQAHCSSLSDRADNESVIEGAYDFYIGRLYQWNLFGQRLVLSAGGMANLGLGFIYNTRNSNNPAQARLHLQLMPSARLDYRFALWRKPMNLSYETQLPLLGMMFSPRYGQSYYEIFGRDNYDRNVVATTFVSAPTFRQQLALDMTLARNFTLRLGLLADLQQAQVNDIKQHIYSYRVLLGLTQRFSVIKK
jgi:hypothetical protein